VSVRRSPNSSLTRAPTTSSMIDSGRLYPAVLNSWMIRSRSMSCSNPSRRTVCRRCSNSAALPRGRSWFSSPLMARRVKRLTSSNVITDSFTMAATPFNSSVPAARVGSTKAAAASGARTKRFQFMAADPTPTRARCPKPKHPILPCGGATKRGPMDVGLRAEDAGQSRRSVTATAPSLVLLVPAYNEEKRIGPVLARPAGHLHHP